MGWQQIAKGQYRITVVGVVLLVTIERSHLGR